MSHQQPEPPSPEHRNELNTSKVICVYCSSSDALTPAFFEVAAELGAQIGRRGYTLIYGGGRWGLMGAVARAVHAHGGAVIGVIPERLLAQSYDIADELIVTGDLRERKALMEARTDAFIGLPGGFGTLEEVLEVLTLKQLGLHRKPIVLINTGGFYDPLLELFERMYRERFVKSAFRRLYHVAPDAESAFAYLDAYRPRDIPPKWF